MKYTLTLLGFVLVVILIMTFSPAQSMGMTTSDNLAEKGLHVYHAIKRTGSLQESGILSSYKKLFFACAIRDQALFS